MKTSCLLLLLILGVSCGKNAFLSKEGSNGPIIRDLNPNQDLHISFDPILNFGSHLISKEVEASVQFINDGDINIDNIRFEIKSDVFKVKETNCIFKKLEVSQVCDTIISFKPNDVKDFSYSIDIQASTGDIKENYKLTLKASGLGQTMPGGVDGPLSIGYLDDEFVDFKTVDIGSTYRRLLYVNAIKNHKVTLVGFRTYDHNNSQVYYSNVKKSCKKTIQKDCFLGLHLKPNKKGSFKEVVFIDYKIDQKDVVYTIPVNIRYKAKSSAICFKHFQDVHPAVTGKSLDTQLAKMSYPYYFQTNDSRAYLYKLGNTETNSRRIVFFRKKYFNEDTQVGFAFPVYKGKEKIYDANVLVDVEKFVKGRDLKKDTEMFCNSEFKTCSGTQFTEREYAKLINPDYKVANKLFSSELMQEGSPYCYLVKYLKWKKSLSLNKYLGISAADLNSQVKKNHMLNFTLTDDVRLMKNPILVSSKKQRVQCN